MSLTASSASRFQSAVGGIAVSSSSGTTCVSGRQR